MRVSRPRFVVGQLPSPGGRVRLSADEAAHVRARRLAPGERVVLIDGTGAEADGEIASIDRSGAEVSVSEVRPPTEAAPAIWLGVCAVRAERISWIAEKAGELGVSTLAIVRSERTQAFRAGAGAAERVERLAQAAAKQSGATRWTRLEGPVSLAQALAGSGAPEASRFFADASGELFPARFASTADPAAILIGPEGGWTDGERAAADAAGWKCVRLPAATLRTETAAIVAVALLRAVRERSFPPEVL